MFADPKFGVKVIDKWDMPRRREFHYSNGIAVWFAHIEEEDKLVPNQGVQLFNYTSYHKPTQAQHGPKRIVCYSKEDFEKLLVSWNKTDSWQYKEVV